MVASKRANRPEGGIGSVLSPLETDVMHLLWKKKAAKVREIHVELRKRKRSVALTSVAVILDRLHEKKAVTRKAETGRGGTHYIYSAASSKEEFEESIIDSMVKKMIDNFGSVAVNYFNERFAGKK